MVDTCEEELKGTTIDPEGEACQLCFTTIDPEGEAYQLEDRNVQTEDSQAENFEALLRTSEATLKATLSNRESEARLAAPNWSMERGLQSSKTKAECYFRSRRLVRRDLQSVETKVQMKVPNYCMPCSCMAKHTVAAFFRPHVGTKSVPQELGAGSNDWMSRLNGTRCRR